MPKQQCEHLYADASDKRFCVDCGKLLIKSKEIGTCAVDSGQLLIVDPCYLSRWKDNEYDAKAKKGELCYSNACDITLKNKDQGGTIGNSSAVVFCSGFGDGVYPVIAHYKDYGTKELPDVRIRKVEILLIN